MIDSGETLYCIYGGANNQKGYIVSFNMTSKAVLQAKVIDPGVGFILAY